MMILLLQCSCSVKCLSFCPYTIHMGAILPDILLAFLRILQLNKPKSLQHTHPFSLTYGTYFQYNEEISNSICICAPMLHFQETSFLLPSSSMSSVDMYLKLFTEELTLLNHKLSSCLFPHFYHHFHFHMTFSTFGLRAFTCKMSLYQSGFTGQFNFQYDLFLPWN